MKKNDFIKKCLYFFLLLISFDCLSQSNVTIVAESFETNGEGTRYTSNTCSVSATAYFLRYTGLPTTPSGFGSVPAWTGLNSDGISCWICENPGNNTCPSLAARTLELATQNVAGYTNLKIKILLADGRANHTANPTQWESNDEVLIEYSMDGGAWTKVGAFYGDQVTAARLRQDLNLNGSSMDADGGTQVPADFTEYSFNVPATGSSMKARIYLPYVGATEELAFDNIRVIGDFSGVAPSIISHPNNQTICASANTSFSIAASNATSYQWQVNTGSGFVNISNGGVYSGATSATLNLTTVPSNMSGYLYRCIAIGSATPNATSNSATLLVNSAPTAPTSINGQNTICSGTSNTYTIASVSGATSYTWILPSGWSGTSTSNTINTTANATSGNISVSASNSCGTSSSTNYSITVNSIPSAPVQIFGGPTICLGTNNGYNINPVAGATSYSWTVPSGFNLISGQTTTSISVNPSTMLGGNISVSSLNACGTSNTISVLVSVNSTPGMPGIISGNSSVCSNSTAQNYTINPVAGAVSYSWSVPSGASISSGQGTNGIVVTYGTISGNISVSASNICGTSPSTIYSVTINSVPSAPSSINGLNTICSGTSNTYSVASVSGATSYNWVLPSGWSGSSNSNTINATANASSGNISVSVSNSCGTSSSANYSITLNAAPSAPLSINGPNTICSGTNNTYSTTSVSGATSYNWLVPSGWTATISSNTMNATASASSGNISVSASNSCGTSSSTNYSVTVISAPVSSPSSINGQNIICSGTNNTYSVSSIAGVTSYNWVLPGGWSGSSSSNTINATANATSGNISVSASNSCGTSPSSNYSVTVNSTPSAPSSVNGQPSVCIGTTNTYSVVSVSGATSYNWTLPGGWSGSSNSSIMNATANGTSGNISVSASNSCGSSVPTLMTITVNVNPTVTISGNTSICLNNSANITAAGALSYLWNTGVSSASISLTPTTTTNYTVIGTDLNGCTDTVIQTINVFVTPIPDNIIVGFTSCQPVGSQISLSCSPASSLYSFSWSFSDPSGTLGSSATNINSLTINSALVTGTLNVSLTDLNGCTTNATPTIINAGSFAPLTPSYVIFSDTVCLGSIANSYSTNNDPNATSYSWSYSGTGESISTSLNSASIDFSSAATSGSLCVFASNGSCNSSPICSPIVVDNCGTVNVKDFVDGDFVNIYPNPTSHTLNIKISTVSRGQIMLCNSLGKQLLIKEIKENEITIDLSGYSSGIYFVQLNTDNKRITKKIIKE